MIWLAYLLTLLQQRKFKLPFPSVCSCDLHSIWVSYFSGVLFWGMVRSVTFVLGIDDVQVLGERK